MRTTSSSALINRCLGVALIALYIALSFFAVSDLLPEMPGAFLKMGNATYPEPIAVDNRFRLSCQEVSGPRITL